MGLENYGASQQYNDYCRYIVKAHKALAVLEKTMDSDEFTDDGWKQAFETTQKAVKRNRLNLLWDGWNE